MVSRRPALRIFVSLIVLGVVLGALFAAAFGGDGHKAPAVQIEFLPTETAQPATKSPTVTPTVAPAAAIRGFAYPITGGCLPEQDDLMPGAPRPYRHGTHEGVDFYDADNCTFIGKGTEVLAAKSGTVIRADLDYQDLTSAELADLDQRVAASAGNDPALEDIFRGRQVWIDHGDGTITRYAHLNGIAEGIEQGKHVNQGELIAYVGESGTPESVTDPGTQVHLHFELRVGASYLGAGRSPDEVRGLYERAFSP